MTPHAHVRSLSPRGRLACLETECRGCRSARADLDGTRAGHLSCLAARREAA